MHSLPNQLPDQTQPTKAHVHVSIPLSWFVALVAMLVVMSFVAGWFVPSPFFKLASRDKNIPVNSKPFVPAGGGSQEKIIQPTMKAVDVAAIASDDEIVVTKHAGKLQFTRIRIAPPVEYLELMAQDPEPRKWVFHAALEELRNFFHESGFSAEQSDALWATHAEEFGDLHIFRPDDAFVRGLSPEVKHKLYTRLGEDDRNIDQVNVYRYLGPSVEAWLEPAKLPADIVAEVQSLSYKNGPFWMFADLPIIWTKLSDLEVRGRLLKVLESEETWRVKLFVDETSDIDALAKYWGRGGRVNQVRPYLDALAQSRDGRGTSTTIRSLLPPFVQTHLHTFPPPTSSAVERERDCHWTAMNFFNTKVNDAFASNSAAVVSEIHEHYTQIYANPTLGDLILFESRDGDNARIFHSAVYLADDLIFTKNGRRSADPFMFMRLDEMKAYYPRSGKVELLYYRRNDLEE